MPSFAIRARAPRGEVDPDAPVHDADLLQPYLEDAAHFPGGFATELLAPSSEAGIARALLGRDPLLAIGAQSSLTGGATPFGERLLSTARLNRIKTIGTDYARVQAGVTLAALGEALAAAGRYYPPVPTFDGAFVGGTIATNAAGAATFKYGTTRDWVQALTVVLPCGEVLDIERGAVVAHPDGYFEIELASGRVRVDVPTYAMPAVPKLSAGYFASPRMDLIDLFIGCEGTLGVISEATLRVLPSRPASCLVLVSFEARSNALAFVTDLRQQAMRTWLARDARGLDIAAIEYMDRRCIALLREQGADIKRGVRLSPAASVALLITLELPPDTSAAAAFAELGSAAEVGAPDTPLARFAIEVSSAGALDDVAIALPGVGARAAQLLTLREEVPATINSRIGRAQREGDRRIEKTAGDLVVPFDRLTDLLEFCEAEFRRRELDAAIWGHLSDGNVHPNVLPRTYDDVVAGKEAILECGREAIRLGGAPLAEHGVGRNPVKQQLLRELYGDTAIEQMRRVKRALDPEWKLAPGVLFARRA